MENKPKTGKEDHFYKEWLSEKQILFETETEVLKREMNLTLDSTHCMKKICRFDILYVAYLMVKANKGSAGIDGISFSKIEASEQGGAIEFLKSIQDELKAKEI